MQLKTKPAINPFKIIAHTAYTIVWQILNILLHICPEKHFEKM